MGAIASGKQRRPARDVPGPADVVYRSIGKRPSDPPMLLIDEADTIFGAKAGDNEDLRGLLNAGHQRNRPTLRYNPGKDDVEDIQTFAMAALAGIGVMPDTIEDRAAIIRMRRRAPGEEVEPYRIRRDGPQLGELRQRLNQWLTAHLDVLTAATPDMPLEDRAADTWEPLIAVADLAGGNWPRAARKAAVALTSDRDAGDEASLHTRLLSDCPHRVPRRRRAADRCIARPAQGRPGSALGNPRTQRTDPDEDGQPATRFRDPQREHPVHHRAGQGLYPQRLR